MGLHYNGIIRKRESRKENEKKEAREVKNAIAEYRSIAKTLRDAADATDKVADLMEKEDCTEAELEEAMKDLAWQFMKLSSIK